MEYAGVLRRRYLGAGRAQAGGMAPDGRCQGPGEAENGPFGRPPASAHRTGRRAIAPKRRGPSRLAAPPSSPPRPRPGPAAPAVRSPCLSRLCQLHILSQFPRDGGPGELDVPHRSCHPDVSRTRGLSPRQGWVGTQAVQRDPGWGSQLQPPRDGPGRAARIRGRVSHWAQGPGGAGDGPCTHAGTHTCARAHARASFDPTTLGTC